MAGLERLDDQIFGRSHEKQMKTKREKQEDNTRRVELECRKDGPQDNNRGNDNEWFGNIDRHEIDISSEEMKILQAADPTLREVWKMGRNNSNDFFYWEGLLPHQWIPRDKDRRTVWKLNSWFYPKVVDLLF